MSASKAEYQAALKRFMQFLGREEELSSASFSCHQLVNITADDVCRYLNYKAFHTERPDDATLPLYARSNTLKSIKKMLSVFMPRQNMPWDDIRGEGNPTRSIAVNNVIKRVMKHEVRKQGVKSQARRPIEFAEFVKILTIIRTNQHYKTLDRYRLASILTMQWQLIARVDDMMKLQHANFSFNPVHVFSLICKMSWSKNITEERESPRQILLASLDERLCVLLNFAVYLEAEGLDNGSTNHFTFGNGIDGDRAVRDLLKYALENTGFVKVIDGNLGTHSIRKGPATYCARNGISKDFIESRGRWKGHRKQVDTYIDLERPVPDSTVASCLCGPNGPIIYKIRESATWCTDTFLSQSIAPAISSILSPQIGVVLAKALVYAAIQRTSQKDDSFVLMPEALRQRIVDAIRVAANHQDGDIEQVVERVPIAVSSVAGELNFVELGVDNPIVSSGIETNVSIVNELAAVRSMLMDVKRRLEEISTSNQIELSQMKTAMHKKLDRVHTSINRIAARPAVERVHGHIPEGAQVEPRSEPRSILSKRPRDLYELWNEYEVGVPGCKPARQFTASERGSCKWMYSFRLNFWTKIETMIRSGYTSDTAIDAVYAAYGRSKSVSDIVRAIRSAKAVGGHPNLH